MRLVRGAVGLFVTMTLLTGVLYPWFITGVAQGTMPSRANGSWLLVNGRVVGSEWIGQTFDHPAYVWGRLPTTSEHPYDAQSSGGSNLGPSNPALWTRVEHRVAVLRHADPDNAQRIPLELVTTSGSGLDPHLSPAAALYQVPRIARARGRSPAEIRALIESCIEPRLLGVIGELHINVLKTNMLLDQRYGMPALWVQ